MSQPKVSVIIPVYNVEKYIEKCTRTLFGQTLDSLEYIFVDDCSPDNSITVMQRVLEEFPNRKDQVKVICHNQNEGVAKSRQDGIDAASGEYIIHCDPDDWVDFDMYESMYRSAKDNDADLVICDFCDVKGDVVNYRSQKPKELTSFSILESMSGLNKSFIMASLWNKLFKSRYCKEIKIPTDLSLGEDQFFLFKVLSRDLKINYINKAFYNYRYNSAGIVHTNNEESLKKSINLINYFKNLVEQSVNERYIACCKSRVILNYYWRIFCSDISSNEYKIKIPFDYQKYILLNNHIDLHNKILLILSANGNYRQAKKLKNFFSEIKSKIT